MPRSRPEIQGDRAKPDRCHGGRVEGRGEDLEPPSGMQVLDDTEGDDEVLGVVEGDQPSADPAGVPGSGTLPWSPIPRSGISCGSPPAK